MYARSIISNSLFSIGPITMNNNNKKIYIHVCIHSVLQLDYITHTYTRARVAAGYFLCCRVVVVIAVVAIIFCSAIKISTDRLSKN